MTKRIRVTVAAVALWLLGAAAAAQPRATLAVRDVFEVGANVYVRALTIEPARGALWVGTSAGVHEVDVATGRLRNTFTRKQGLANEYVFAVGIDRAGYKWFGTNAGGASRYKDGKWKTYFPMHGLADYWIYAFASQRDGSLWIGTWAGANRFDLKTGKFTTYVKELVNEWVYGITV
ncbi:MAG: regulator, partial [Burkholderiaceae bacterium]|nr:regulator [Burkholderiaceae bacterium]